MKKKERQQLIASLITTREIATQDELVRAIKAASGDYVTQATISRDIKELALIKVPAKFGALKYRLPQGASNLATQRLQPLISASLLEAKIKGNIIALRTIPGSALALKRLICERFSKDLFSILADDDSLLIYLEDAVVAKDWLRKLKQQAF
ncbi:MAG: hypothetical protein LBS33_01580 [Streptococcaceae bacterium]|jgi:transcriptional regulator of arginine metabolism|nr:hypothetical protein [Streptococcaceae bacterium]